ncbi:MAG TPA: RodZ domain-containing protein [Candidatus Cybelea sp.]|jgi:cytoskeletal protein RodZ|nr:RodZ domain-containing protein [Candidatus Cybelea sp.]
MSDAQARDLGERFRAAREARGISLSDAAERIRIRSLYLAAIEEGNCNAIGPPVYIRGFLRTYARFLGLDPEEAVADFNRSRPDQPSASLLAGEAEPQRGGGARRGAFGGGLLIWLAGAVAVLLIAFVVYNELTLRGQQSTVAVASAEASPSGLPSATPSPEPSPTPAAGGPKSLALVLSAPSWLRVTVDGNVSMEGTFPAGTSKTFHGKNALVRIGNAGGVEIYVDGKDRGKLGKSGDVVEQVFAL